MIGKNYLEGSKTLRDVNGCMAIFILATILAYRLQGYGTGAKRQVKKLLYVR